MISLQEHLTQFQDEVTQKESECVTLRNLLEERNAFITTMKSEIYRKEYRMDTQRVDLQNQILQKDAAIKKLEVCGITYFLLDWGRTLYLDYTGPPLLLKNLLPT